MTTKGADDEFVHLITSAKKTIFDNCTAKREAPKLKEQPWFLMKLNYAENVKSLLTQLVFDARHSAEHFAALTADCLVDLIRSKQRATEVHACYLLEDIEVREFIEINKQVQSGSTSAEIQVLSLSGGQNLKVKIVLGLEAYSLTAGESMILDNVNLEAGISLEVMMGDQALGKTNYNLAPKSVPNSFLMTKETVTVKGPLEIRGITLMLQTQLTLSMTDRLALLRENLQDLEDKLSLKEAEDHKLSDLMGALDIAVDEDQGFRSMLRKPIPPKDRDCECRLL
jgi:hypothetical protein